MKNHNKFQYELGYKKGCSDAGFYWTALITIALHNLYGWRNNFEKVEDEMYRLHQELKNWKTDKLVGEKLLAEIEKIRGKQYIDEILKERKK